MGAKPIGVITSLYKRPLCRTPKTNKILYVGCN